MIGTSKGARPVRDATTFIANGASVFFVLEMVGSGTVSN